MFGIDAAIYVYCTYVFVENKNLKPEFHNTFYWAYDYLSMLGLKFIHVDKKDRCR